MLFDNSGVVCNGRIIGDADNIKGDIIGWDSDAHYNNSYIKRSNKGNDLRG